MCQFTSEPEKKNLSDYLNIDKEAYPIGRLDFDSEGLLIITNDRRLNYRLLNPKFHHQRTYLVQVEGLFDNNAVNLLQRGIDININGGIFKTTSCKVEILENATTLYERVPPIRFRANIPTSLIKIYLTEGKNRQVRKMTAKVGFPALRLLRFAIEDLTLEGIMPGEYKEIGKEEIYHLLKI